MNQMKNDVFRVNRQLIYYQWVPFLMALEAGFFYFPVLFWAQTNNKSGLNISAMVGIVELVRESGSEVRLWDGTIESINHKHFGPRTSEGRAQREPALGGVGPVEADPEAIGQPNGPVLQDGHSHGNLCDKVAD
jgi:hypothetical protein